MPIFASRSRSLLAFVLFLPALVAAQTQSSASGVRTGIWRGQPVTYAIVHGKPLFQGDILLDHVQPMLGASRGLAPSRTIAYSQYLWPKVAGVATVYYTIDSASDPNATPKINAAIAQFNSDFPGIIQWVQWNAQNPQGPNYVDINLSAGNFSGQCEANEGYEAIPAQPATGSTLCTVGTILHEMGHVIGLWHEQTRSDRDNYVTVNYQNIIKGSRFNFDVIQDNVQDLTLYDYSSLMQYPVYSFSRNGGPAIETVPAGMPLGSFDGIPVPATADYSAADKEGIERLYGAPPTKVTVTSNPPGLQVIVDGATVTTPQVFAWALNSTHTLDVPANVQSLSGFITNSTTTATFYYTYGRWNDSTSQSHTITVTPGNGELPFPATSPQVATYTANFIQLVPYTAAVFPSNPVSGSVSVSPQPQSYPGASGLFFVAREQATLTATPNSGFNFYEFNNGPFWLPGGLGANPKTFYVPDTGNPVNTTAEFSNAPVYTFDLTPETFSANTYAYIDGGFWFTPKNFSAFYDSGWNSGSQHTINVDSDEFPYSINSRYAFSSWSDGGAQSHNIVLPGASASYVATMTPEFAPADNWQFGLPCGSASASISPSSGDGFYPAGQVLTFSQTPASGWSFAGWSYDLSGLTSPQDLTVTDEVLVYANYNTVSTPLTMTALTPPSTAAGGGSLTLTITGTGFTHSTQVWVNNTFRSSSFVNSTTLKVQLTAADIATPGAFQIFVQNFPTGSACSVSAAMPFFVFQGSASVAPTPTSITFRSQAVGTTSVSQKITLKNTGNSPASVTIAASGDFSQTNTCNGSIKAAGSCTVTVTFAPSATGSITGSVTVTDNAASSPQIVSLTGTGVAPLSFSPASLSFGSVTVGTTSAAKTVTLTNNSSATLNLSLTASGNYSAIGNGTTPCGTTLASTKKCTISVTFSPTANGSINGAVTVIDGAAFSPQNITLSGSGTGGGTSPLSFTPTSLSFTSQPTGTISAAKTVTVKNRSTASVTLSSISSSGNFAATGTGTTPCNSGTVLARNGSCTLNVTFSPTIAGTIRGAVTITDNASIGQQIVNVSGTAVAPVTFSPTSLTFAAQTVGTTSASQTVTLTNNLTAALNNITVSASGDFSLASNGCVSSVAANGQCTFSVAFTPSQTGVVNGSVTITDSDSTSPQIVDLSGTGQ